MRLFKQKEDKEVRSSGQPKHLFAKGLPILVCVLFIAFTAIAALVSHGGVQKARAANWTTVWSDDFNGSAGSGLDTSTWKYDTGTGWGTGEIETMSSSTANVQHDGNGHLQVTAVRDSSGN